MSSLGSNLPVEVNDCLFCSTHKLEVCRDCEFDAREDNDLTFGFDPNPNRTSLELPAWSTNKDGVLQCKKHSNMECKQCFGWKKQIQKLHTAAKKAK